MVSCPKCHGELLLPEGADQQSIFDCPHCQASYPLSDALLSSAGNDDGNLLIDLDEQGKNEQDLDLDLDLDDTPLDVSDAMSESLDGEANELSDLDFGIEFDEQENLGTDIELSAAAKAALTANSDEITGIDDIGAEFVDDAMNTESVEVPIEVVKPFDLEPSPDQITAKDFKPGIPRSGGGVVSSLLKFGIGGLLGLLLCQAGLWWIGHLDPLGLAPQLPEVVGFLAPDSVRSPYRSLVANRPPSLEPSELPPPMEDREDFGVPEQPDMEQPDMERPPLEQAANEQPADPPLVPLDPNDTLEPDDTTQPEDTDNRASAFPTTDVLVEPVTNSVQTVEHTADSLEAPLRPSPTVDDPSSPFVNDNDVFATEQTGPAPMIGLVSKQQLHRNDLSSALGETSRALDALIAAGAARASREDRLARMYEFYDVALKMAENAIHVDDDAAPVLSQMQNFVEGVSKYGVLIGKAAARRLPDSQRQGVFLSGTVTGKSPLDAKYQRIQVTLLGDRPLDYQVIAPNIAIARIGDRVFVLGIRVADPTLEISGLSAAVDGPAVWSDRIIPMQ